MPIADKVAAANQLNEFLKGVIRHGGFQLKYRITARNYCGLWNCSPLTPCVCTLASMEKSVSIEAATAPCASKNCARWRTSLQKKFGALEPLTHSLP